MQLSLRFTVVYSTKHETQNLAFGGQKTGPGRAQNRVQKTKKGRSARASGATTTPHCDTRLQSMHPNMNFRFCCFTLHCVYIVPKEKLTFQLGKIINLDHFTFKAFSRE